MPVDLSTIRIVLVHPQTPENIGMAARAMKNCGLSRLVLVRPADFRSAAAYRPAMEAFPLLDGAEVHSDLLPAIADSRLVIGTTRRGGQDRRPLLTPADLVREVLPRAKGEEVSILFGGEKDGLSREAVDQCDILVTIPAHPDFPSFNLAQSVLLISYEIFRGAAGGCVEAESPALASSSSREDLYRHLEAVLHRIGFLHENNPGRILSTVRRLFGRAILEDREVRILRGMLSQLEWALDRPREEERT
jgi:tRNA/rRNA methyltransferase